MCRIVIGTAMAICLTWNTAFAEEVGRKPGERPKEPAAGRSAPQPSGAQPAGPSRRPSPPEGQAQKPWWLQVPAERPARYGPPSVPRAPRKRTVVPLKNSPAQQVAETISKLLDGERRAASRPTEHSVVIVPEAISNTLLISAAPDELDQLEPLIESLDRAQPMVLIQMLIAQATLPDPKDDNPARPAGGRAEDETQRQITGLPAGSHFSADRLKREVELSVLGTPSVKKGIDQRLGELRKQRPLEVLSRPQLTTVNNCAARLQLGGREPVVRSSSRGPSGPIQQVEYIDVGQQLMVTPRVAPDGRVSMEISLMISRLGASEDEGALSGSQPVQGSRIVTIEAEGTVTVPDGQTVVLAGLKSSGGAGQEELLIIVTPHVVN